MIRDEEINRLVRYAQGMGLSVRFKPYIKHSHVMAEWMLDGTELIIYESKRDSKLQTVLSLIHELGHHKSFVQNGRKIDKDFQDALSADDPNKVSRKTIWQDETFDSQYWEDIYRDTNCKFPIYRLHMQKELDLWIYEVYYKKGKWPKGTEKRRKTIELKKKYKNL